MIPELPPWAEIARQEAAMGVRELVGPKHSARVLEYHRTTTLAATDDETPWCAAFVGWCLERAGFGSTRSARARSYLAWGVGLYPWAYGGIVVLQRGRGPQPGIENHTAQGHVGFLCGSPTPSDVLVLGGNQSNAVSVRAYPRASVLSVRWAKP